MMPQLRPALGVCPHCSGFAAVAVTTGTRRPSGTLPTGLLLCPACSGTGTAPAWLALADQAATVVFAMVGS
jgi:hypothetical protein